MLNLARQIVAIALSMALILIPPAPWGDLAVAATLSHEYARSSISWSNLLSHNPGLVQELGIGKDYLRTFEAMISPILPPSQFDSNISVQDQASAIREALRPKVLEAIQTQERLSMAHGSSQVHAEKLRESREELRNFYLISGAVPKEQREEIRHSLIRAEAAWRVENKHKLEIVDGDLAQEERMITLDPYRPQRFDLNLGGGIRVQVGRQKLDVLLHDELPFEMQDEFIHGMDGLFMVNPDLKRFKYLRNGAKVAVGSVSGEHVWIARKNDSIVVEDLGTAYGTKVISSPSRREISVAPDGVLSMDWSRLLPWKSAGINYIANGNGPFEIRFGGEYSATLQISAFTHLPTETKESLAESWGLFKVLFRPWNYFLGLFGCAGYFIIDPHLPRQFQKLRDGSSVVLPEGRNPQKFMILQVLGKTISSSHVAILQNGDLITITDQGSKYGTEIAGVGPAGR